MILLNRVYALAKIRQVKYNRKDRLKNMRATTLEVVMLADVSGAYSAISSVNLCVTRPLWHKPSSLFSDVIDSHWSTKRYMARPLNLDDLLWITS